MVYDKETQDRIDRFTEAKKKDSRKATAINCASEIIASVFQESVKYGKNLNMQELAKETTELAKIFEDYLKNDADEKS